MYETDWTAELLLLESATIMGCKSLHHDHVVVKEETEVQEFYRHPEDYASA